MSKKKLIVFVVLGVIIFVCGLLSCSLISGSLSSSSTSSANNSSSSLGNITNSLLGDKY